MDMEREFAMKFFNRFLFRFPKWFFTCAFFVLLFSTPMTSMAQEVEPLSSLPLKV